MTIIIHNWLIQLSANYLDTNYPSIWVYWFSKKKVDESAPNHQSSVVHLSPHISIFFKLEEVVVLATLPETIGSDFP